MMADASDTTGTSAAGRAAIALATLIERRCELLQRLVEQKDGEGRTDG